MTVTAGGSAYVGTLSSTVNLEAPDPSSLKLLDIVVGMARMNRFNGQTVRPVSVLAHSIEVARAVARALQLDPSDLKKASLEEIEAIYQGLMHDTSEGIISDILSPMKRMEDMRGYLRIEQRFMKALSQRYQFPGEELDIVKKADREVLLLEARAYGIEADSWAGSSKPMYSGAAYSNLREEAELFGKMLISITERLSELKPELRTWQAGLRAEWNAVEHTLKRHGFC